MISGRQENVSSHRVAGPYHVKYISQFPISPTGNTLTITYIIHVPSGLVLNLK